MVSARSIREELGYAEWRNFEGIIKRAISIVKHKHLNAKIEKTKVEVKIGSGAKRNIVDYNLDDAGFLLIKELSTSYKLNKFFSIRNETVVLSLVQKYCKKKGISFEFQYKLEKYVFDCVVGGRILLEFDEPHHKQSKRQKEIDADKDDLARQRNYEILRITLDMDIIDIIIFLEKEL